jgi:tetratricopeptide (TPR) repeat protein
MSRTPRLCLQPLALLCLGLAAALPVAAQEARVEIEVKPTDVEWQQLSPFCQARYSVTLYAQGTKYQNAVPAVEVQNWQQRMGVAWEGLHHYCYGLIQMSRAPLVLDAGRRSYVYGRAIEELAFAYNNTKPHPFRAQMAVQLALAYRAEKKLDEALRYVNEARQIDPKLEAAYSAKALILRQQGALADAAVTLEDGITAIDGESAELNYFLGLTYFDLGQFDRAQAAADKAYGLGYPLPGLRNRLARREQSAGR